MAEPRPIFSLQLNESGEAVLASVIAEALEEVDDDAADLIDIVVYWCINHQPEGVSGGDKGCNNIVRS